MKKRRNHELFTGTHKRQWKKAQKRRTRKSPEKKMSTNKGKYRQTGGYPINQKTMNIINKKQKQRGEGNKEENAKYKKIEKPKEQKKSKEARKNH